MVKQTLKTCVFSYFLHQKALLSTASKANNVSSGRIALWGSRDGARWCQMLPEDPRCCLMLPAWRLPGAAKCFQMLPSAPKCGQMMMPPDDPRHCQMLADVPNANTSANSNTNADTKAITTPIPTHNQNQYIFKVLPKDHSFT